MNPPPSISASGRGRCRAAGYDALAPALDYPTRPVHLVEGFGAGGAPDIIARLIGQALSERLGQSFVIENRAGAKQQYCRRGGGAGTPGWLHRLLRCSGSSVHGFARCSRLAPASNDFLAGLSSGM